MWLIIFVLLLNNTLYFHKPVLILALHAQTQHHVIRVLFRHFHATYHNSVHAPMAHTMTGYTRNVKIARCKPAQLAQTQPSAKHA